MNTLTSQEKKETLILLIDDMTAAALNRSGQGYTQFLQCRNQLLKTIDMYAEADSKRDALTKHIYSTIDRYYETEGNVRCMPNITI